MQKTLMVICSILLVAAPATLTSASSADICMETKKIVRFSELSMDDQSCSEIAFIDFGDHVLLSVPSPDQLLVMSDLEIGGSETEFLVWNSATQGVKASKVSSTSPLQDSWYKSDLITMPLIDSGWGSVDSSCSNSSYTLGLGKLTSGYSWWYNPLGQSSSRSLARIQEAVNQWKFPKNRCTLESFDPNFTASYMGASTTLSNLATYSGCAGSPDWKNSISWGVLPTNVLGRTCKLIGLSSGQIQEADIRLAQFDIQSQLFYDYPDPTQCGVGDYLLLTTVAHEVGHALGLAHSAEQSGQLMAPRAPACIHEFVGLGPGDYSGFKQLYAERGLYEAI